MALTFKEAQEMKALEAEESQALSMQPKRSPSNSGLSLSEQRELESLEAEESQFLNNQNTSNSTADAEAELGFINRARYALEPISSNREALLRQEYGDKNVVNQNGELYLKQYGKLRPVNESGFSMADVADFAGALPETLPTALGSFIGGAGGAVVGAPAGPGAIASGAAGLAAGRAVGGGLGSIFRQATSAAVGTPQVATLPERLQETAISAGSSVVGGKIADVAIPYLSKVPGIRSLFSGEGKTIGKQAIKEEIPQSLEQTLSMELNPIASDAIESVNYPREVIDQQLEKLKGIAQRQGLPEPTYAQAAGGKAILAEGKLMETPLVGGKVRSQVDKQLKAVKEKLENLAGKFIDGDSTAYEVGLATKELAQTNEQVQKKMAQELYQKVESEGQNAFIGKSTFFNKYRDFAGKHGLINPDLTPSKYAADTGLTRSEFNELQSIVFDAMIALKNTKSPKIRFDSVNALRKTLNSASEELSDKSPNAARLLNELVTEINSTSERVLSKEAPKLGEVFKEANRNWAIYKDFQNFNKSIFSEGMGEEKIVKKLLSDSAKVEKMKEVIGQERVREVGISYIKDILEPLSKSGVARADSALSLVKKNSAQIKAAIGESDYVKLTETLYYLNRVNQPLNISRASLYSLLDESKGGIKGFVARIASTAKTQAEATGRPVSEPVTKLTKKASDAFDKTIGKGMTRGNIGNILSDSQRPDIQMKKSGDRFVKNKDEDQNYRKPSERRK